MASRSTGGQTVGSRWTIHCVAIEHYENFPVASLLCPARLRPPITAIYHFARTADDIADEGTETADQRLAALADYAGELHAAIAGHRPSRWPAIMLPLVACIDRYSLPVSLLHDLLSAFAQDCGNPQYTDRHQLLDYCSRSANPIGRLLLHLYGVSDAPALAQSDAICTSLQLINFWQDPSVDLARGRNYFPLRDLERHGLVYTDLAPGRDTPVTQALLAELTHWASMLMLEGRPLIRRLPGRVGWELALVVAGGLRILAKISAMQHRTLSARPRLRPWDMPTLFGHAAWLRLSSWPASEAIG